jgi:predicted nucleic acid-binding protein
MTVVIADSSPLNYLTLIGSVDVLYRLYGTVIVPQQVIAELIDPAAPHEFGDGPHAFPTGLMCV